MIYVALALLAVLCITLPVVAVLVTLQVTTARTAAGEELLKESMQLASANMNIMLTQIAEGHKQQMDFAKKLIDEQTKAIVRQQKTIEETHSRLVLPMERAVADVANAHDRTSEPQIPVYAGDIPQIPDFATSEAFLPNDLDPGPDDL